MWLSSWASTPSSSIRFMLVQQPGGDGDGGVPGVAAGGEGVGRVVLDHVDPGLGQAAGDAEALDQVVQPGVARSGSAGRAWLMARATASDFQYETNGGARRRRRRAMTSADRRRSRAERVTAHADRARRAATKPATSSDRAALVGWRSGRTSGFSGTLALELHLDGAARPRRRPRSTRARLKPNVPATITAGKVWILVL